MAQQTLPKFAYIRGAIVPYEQASLGVMTHAFNYGTGVFGGIRAYWNADEEQLYIFRPYDHFQRILQSAHIMRMHVSHSVDELVEILRSLLQKENYRENAYARPIVYKSTEMIGVRLHDIDDDVTIYAVPFGQYVASEDGLHVCFSSWQRVSDNTMPARGKVTGAYANSALIKSDAILAGYDEAFVLTADGHLSEGSAANVMMVRDGQLITSPISDDILEGITRRTLLQLAAEQLGVTVVERKIDRTEVYLAEELLMCGTGMQIAAVTQIEHRQVGDGRMGAITRQLRDLYFEVVAGRIDAYRDWLTPVYCD
ncbi:MAG: branched-chain amino acid transaminase [Anaerolineae bacterium]